MSIFSKIGKAVKGAAKFGAMGLPGLIASRGVKGAIKGVGKVATFPARTLVKGVGGLLSGDEQQPTGMAIGGGAGMGSFAPSGGGGLRGSIQRAAGGSGGMPPGMGAPPGPGGAGMGMMAQGQPDGGAAPGGLLGGMSPGPGGPSPQGESSGYGGVLESIMGYGGGGGLRPMGDPSMKTGGGLGPKLGGLGPAGGGLLGGMPPGMIQALQAAKGASQQPKQQGFQGSQGFGGE